MIGRLIGYLTGQAAARQDVFKYLVNTGSCKRTGHQPLLVRKLPGVSHSQCCTVTDFMGGEIYFIGNLVPNLKGEIILKIDWHLMELLARV